LSYVQEDENTAKTDGCYIVEVNTQNTTRIFLTKKL